MKIKEIDSRPIQHFRNIRTMAQHPDKHNKALHTSYAPFDSNFAIEKYLDKLGWKRTEKTGWHSRVFENPTKNYVLKIYSTNETGYVAFLRFALANQDSPHIPKIIGKPIKLSDNVSAVRLEKLESFGIYDNYSDLFTEIDNFIQLFKLAGQINKFFNIFRKHKNKNRKLASTSKEKAEKMIFLYRNSLKALESTQPKTFVEILKKLIAFGIKNNVGCFNENK